MEDVEWVFYVDKDKEMVDSSVQHLVHWAIRVIYSSNPKSAIRQQWDWLDVLRIGRVDRLQYAKSELEQVMPAAADGTEGDLRETHTLSKAAA